MSPTHGRRPALITAKITQGLQRRFLDQGAIRGVTPADSRFGANQI